VLEIVSAITITIIYKCKSDSESSEPSKFQVAQHKTRT